MRLGISFTLPHSSPAEWAEKTQALGLRAVVFPVDHTAPDSLIDAYAAVCRDYDLTIAEVGAWKNLMDPDPAARKSNYEYVRDQLALADRVGANCCVDISGAVGEVWDGGYPGNYLPETFDRVVDTVKSLIRDARVRRTAFTLEPMPWMLPWDGESYRKLLDAVDDPRFAVHMDAINLMNSPERYFHCAAFLKETFALLHGRIRSVHVKDVRLERTLTLHLKEVPIGDGGFDVPAYARLAEAEGPDTPFIVEHLGNAEAYYAALDVLKPVLQKEGIVF
ncbi:MAG: sugar phosphate isomerase/epimerase [Clostridia bacterium]|nr:sugar phosphate isomerase/epimerase [Clostridia bacterium]